jgi:hypothetical protein
MTSRRFMTGIGFPPTRMLDYTSRRPPCRSRFAASPACRWKGQRGWWHWRASGPMSGVGANPDFLLGSRTSASAECRHWSARAVRWSSCAILLRLSLLSFSPRWPREMELYLGVLSRLDRCPSIGDGMVAYRPRTRRERSTSRLCRPAMTSASCRSSAARAPESSARASASPPLCTAVCKLIRRSSSRCRVARGSSSPLIRPPHRLHLQGSAASARRSPHRSARDGAAAPPR